MNRITLDETVMVSDPCYSDETWCQVKLKNVLPGQYLTTAHRIEDTYWGERSSVLLAVHEDYMGQDLSWRNHPGDVGVDSGQAGIFSMASYRVDDIEMDTPDKTYNGQEFVLPYSDKPGDEWYEKMCKFTLSSEGWGSYDTGVVSTSGIGDGGYRCLVAKKNGKIVGIAIDFFMEKFPNKFINDLIEYYANITTP